MSSEQTSPSLQEVPLGVVPASFLPVSPSVGRGDCAPSGELRGSVAATGGREAPLDLIEEHLTYRDTESPYRQGVQGGELLKNWFFPRGWSGTKEGKENLVLKVQPFAKGGYEATLRSLDLEKIGRAIDADRPRGKREAKETVSVQNQMKAAARSKRKMRHLVKNMMADHLVTFTRRELEGAEYWTPEQWAAAWDRFRRLLVRVIGDFPYVAILEKHKKGNYHLHVAWVEAPGQKVNLNLVRGCWWAVLGGRGQGNVDAQYIKVRAGVERADRVAKYISKYTTKHFEEDGRFNKKRYWASRQRLAPVRRFVLNTGTVSDSLNVVQKMFGINLADYMRKGRDGLLQYDGFFPFPDGSGFWMTYIPEKHGGAPPPF